MCFGLLVTSPFCYTDGIASGTESDWSQVRISHEDKFCLSAVFYFWKTATALLVAFCNKFSFSIVPSYYKLRRTNLPSTQVEKHTREKLYKVAVMRCIKYWSATAVQLLPTFYPVANLLCIIRIKWYRVRVMPKSPMRHSRCSNLVRVGICVYSIRQMYPVASIPTLLN